MGWMEILTLIIGLLTTLMPYIMKWLNLPAAK